MPTELGGSLFQQPWIFGCLDSVFCFAITLWVMWRAGNMFNVIAYHKLLKLTGTIRRTIVTLQLVGDSMRGEVSLQGSNHFIASLILELVDFEVAGIVIYGAEVISVFPVEDIASDCFPCTVWNFVRDKWFLLLMFLVSCAHATLC